MVKVFFFDIDGTLFDSKTCRVSDAVHRSVHLLHDRGVIPILVSGRPPFAIRSLADSLSTPGFIAYNGGLAVVDGETVYNNPIEPTKVAELAAIAEANGHPLVFPGVDKYYTTMADHPRVRQIFWRPPTMHPSYWVSNPTYQVELIAPIEVVGHCYARFRDDFHFYPWHGEPFATNVNPGTSSKAVGMRHVLKWFGLNESHAAAIGDGPNDVEMIQAAGVGIAMGNACMELKSVADIITDNVSADGAAKAIMTVLDRA